jgi:alkylation response protein AidB-like acyl-CoA dehydrogenase
MRGQLLPTTEAGKRVVALAEEHAADFATRAQEHDLEGSLPHENFDAMKKSGFIAGPIPEAFGGMGVTNIHDIGVAMSRLARGDGSTAIAVNMHLGAAWTMQRLHAAETATGNIQLAPVIEGLMKAIGSGQLVAAIFATEAGTTVGYPNTALTREGDGYVLNGQKIFATLSPAATIYFAQARVKVEDGEDTGALVMLGKGTPGVEVKDNWDALGMRASGSGDVALKDVRVGAGNVVAAGEPLGSMSANQLEMILSGNLGLISCFVGIAEAAADMAIEMAKTRRKGPSNKTLAERPWIQHLAGEMMVELETCRGMQAYAARVCDDYVDRYPTRGAPLDEAIERQRQFQAAKYVVNRKAIDVVDKAMTISGGAGYMTKHPLSRLYRDVRAGPFMQPFSPGEAIEFIGRVALDQDPRPDN